jgi:hypothetical protein
VTSNCNARVLNIYATGSLARFKSYFYCILKNVLAYYNAGVVAVNVKVIGLTTGLKNLPGCDKENS